MPESFTTTKTEEKSSTLFATSTTTTSSSSLPSSFPRLTCPQFDVTHLHLSNSTPLGAGAISHVVRSQLIFSHNSGKKTPVSVKILSKIQLLQQHKVESVMNEKEALLRLAPSPFIVRLFGTAQSEDEVYFVLEWLPHGDLLQHIRRSALARKKEYWSLWKNRSHCEYIKEATGGGEGGRDKEGSASPVSAFNAISSSSRAVRCLGFSDIQLIAAQLILALDRVVEKGVVLRDLKPENIAFDDHYRACLIDFDTVDLAGATLSPSPNTGCSILGGGERGRTHDTTNPAFPSSSSPNTGHTNSGGNTNNAKKVPRPSITVSEIQRMRQRNSSFCGTAQHVSPEMVGSCRWSFSSDLWALGTTLYECLYGTPMFQGSCTFEVLQKIVKNGEPAEHVPFPEVDFPLSTTTTTTATRQSEMMMEGKEEERKGEINEEERERKEGVEGGQGEGEEFHSPHLVPTSVCGGTSVSGSSPDSIGADPKNNNNIHSSSSTTGHAGCGEGDAAALPVLPCSSPFARLKDFILRLVVLNPRERLGVERERGTWCVNILRQHCFFADFDWRVLDQQVRDYRAHDFRQPPSVRDVYSSRKGEGEGEEEEAKYIYDDGTPSLASRYADLPFNDEKYAAYVYEATADTDPFQAFLLRTAGMGPERECGSAKESPLPALPKQEYGGIVREENEKKDEEKAKEMEKEEDGVEGAGDIQQTLPKENLTDNDDDDDDDDVIDDVGMQLNVAYDTEFSTVFGKECND